MNGWGDRIVSLSEFEALEKALPEYTLVLTLGYYLRMRRGKILTLRESQIHFSNGSSGGYIHLTETKNGDERLVPFQRRDRSAIKKTTDESERGSLVQSQKR
jgi:integrase